MNSIWNKNLEAFRSRFPALFEMCKKEISAIKDEEGSAALISSLKWEVLTAKNGDISAREGGTALHSLYNPSREASNAVAQTAVAEKSSALFYGFGLGWQVIEFCKKYPDKKLVLLEPDLLHLLGAFLLLDWSEVFAHEKLILAVGCPQESVLSLIEDSSRVNVGNTGVNDTFFFDLPAFTNHAAEYFNDVRTIIKRNQRKNEINAATLKKFGKLWVRNSRKNIDQLTRCQGLAGFKNAGKEVPFLIVGAGPSLEGILPHLAELKKRMVIICVETALHTLLKNGIQPDFIMLMDPQFWAFRHIAGLSAPESVLITEVSAYPAVFRFPCKKIMLCKSQFPVGQYFEKKLSLDLGDLGTGGSVASAAWNFAYFCGAKKIFTAGLDLSFPSKQTHIKGSSAEQTFHTLARRTRTVENFTAATLFSANASPAENYLGERVTTDSRMKMFAWWFEARLANCPDTKTFTLCPQSMKIPGIEVCKLQDALALPEITGQKEAFLAAKMPEPASEHSLKAIKDTFPNSEFFENASFLRDYF
ncbi:hypothetical protein MSI_16960 [Treponema sp. JC4]|uniref:motility associated factor glycosyltransferase family protein n=1 Tax=Treponema sp. JC4 TaxID=1124982 RepID=UPI00025AFD74|nr:6-hydroxymethylpterin diphosphokinase MptE-like protein [Treponema sp. JC4]EID84829.1 hypothetical protein MSI_16960 [Treponema sp. JC4]